MTPTKAPERPKAAPAEKDIDPRIRARRIEVKRDEGRRRLRRVGVLGIVVVSVVALWALAQSPLLDVDTIDVSGATRTGDDAVRDAIGIDRGDALLTVDVDGAAKALASLSWVATADVRRSWPGTVRVTIVEREPIAAIAAAGGGWVLVDRGGRMLAVEQEPALELVRIAGRRLAVALGETAGERYRGSIDVAAVVPDSLRAALGALWPQGDGSVEATVKLPSGAEAVARFGAADQLEAKLVALAAVLERADLANVRVIDLRVPGAPALTRG